MQRRSNWFSLLPMSYPYHSHGGQYQHEEYSASEPQVPQWATLDPQQQQQQQQQHQHDQPSSEHFISSAPPTPQALMQQQFPSPSFPLELETSDLVVQTRSPTDHAPILLHPAHSPPDVRAARSDGIPSPGDSGELHIDTTMIQTRPSTASATSPAPTPVTRAGRSALRRSPGPVTRNPRQHPYPRRQQSATPGPGPSSMSRHHGNRGELDDRSFMVPAPILTTNMTSMPVVLATGTGTSMSTPPSSAPGFGHAVSGAPYTPTSMPPPPHSGQTTPSATTPSASYQLYPVGSQAQPQSHFQQVQPSTSSYNTARVRPHQYTPRSDIQYDYNSHMLTAVMEIPGVRRENLRVTLSTCTVNRLKQVVVHGWTTPVFPPLGSFSTSFTPSASTSAGAPSSMGVPSPAPVGTSGDVLPSHYQIRERKYGEFKRIFPVPTETKPHDIDGKLENGVLTLKIACGMPATSADVQDIAIH